MKKNTVKISSECMAFTVSNVCISTWRQLRARSSSWHTKIFIIFSVKTSTFPEIWRRFAKHARPYFSFINYADIKFTNKSLVIFMVSIDGLFFQLYSNLSIHCGMNSRQIVTETIFVQNIWQLLYSIIHFGPFCYKEPLHYRYIFFGSTYSCIK